MSANLVLTPAEAQSFTLRRQAIARQKEEKRLKALRTNQRCAHPGRPASSTHATWVTDMGELQQGIVLCGKCQHKFDPAKYNYYRTREFNIIGRCDACKEMNMQGSTFFIHESLLGRKHGQCWMPR